MVIGMRWLAFLLSSGLFFGCGGSSSGDGGGSGGTSGGGGASGGGGTSGTGGSAGTSGGGGTSGSGGSAGDAGVSTPCGPKLVCDAKSVCIVDEKAAACTPKMDDAGPCPAGKTQSQCGGIGYPCCCDPPPPSEYRCESAAGCSGAPDCTCLKDVCKGGQMCMGIGGKDREFHCSDPPVP